MTCSISMALGATRSRSRSPGRAPSVCANWSRGAANRDRLSTKLRHQLGWRDGAGEDPDRYVGLFVQGMARRLLSAKTSRRENARVLRRADADGRDQLHLPRDAEVRDAGRVGLAHAGEFSLRAEGSPAHHALREAA